MNLLEKTVNADQIFIVIIFLLSLVLLWLFVRLSQKKLFKKLGANRRLQLSESLALSSKERVLVLRFDKKEYLILQGRNTAATVISVTQGRIEP